MTHHDDFEHENFTKQLQKPNKIALQLTKTYETFEHFQLGMRKPYFGKIFLPQKTLASKYSGLNLLTSTFLCMIYPFHLSIAPSNYRFGARCLIEGTNFVFKATKMPLGCFFWPRSER